MFWMARANADADPQRKKSYLERAAPYLTTAADTAPGSAEPPISSLAYANANLGYTLYLLGRLDAARARQRKAYEIYQRAYDPEGVAGLFHGMADVSASLEKAAVTSGRPAEAVKFHQEAVDLLQRSIAIREKLGDPMREGDAHLRLALVESSANLASARQHCSRAIELRELARSRVANEVLRTSTFETVADHYYACASIFATNPQGEAPASEKEAAFEMAEKGRARRLLEGLSAPPPIRMYLVSWLKNELSWLGKSRRPVSLKETSTRPRWPRHRGNWRRSMLRFEDHRPSLRIISCGLEFRP